MAILTFGTVAETSATIFTLNKADLEAHNIVAADDYFNDAINFSKVAVTYKTTVSDQLENFFFDYALDYPTHTFEPPTGTTDDWEVQAVVIYDHDGGTLTLRRINLETTDFDFTVGDAVATGIRITQDFRQPYDIIAPQTILNRIDVEVYDQNGNDFDIGGAVAWRVKLTGGAYGVEVTGDTEVNSYSSGYARFQNIEFASAYGFASLEFSIPSRPDLGIITSKTINVTNVPTGAVPLDKVVT